MQLKFWTRLNTLPHTMPCDLKRTKQRLQDWCSHVSTEIRSTRTQDESRKFIVVFLRTNDRCSLRLAAESFVLSGNFQSEWAIFHFHCEYALRSHLCVVLRHFNALVPPRCHLSSWPLVVWSTGKIAYCCTKKCKEVEPRTCDRSAISRSPSFIAANTYGTVLSGDVDVVSANGNFLRAIFSFHCKTSMPFQWDSFSSLCSMFIGISRFGHTQTVSPWNTRKQCHFC